MMFKRLIIGVVFLTTSFAGLSACGKTGAGCAQAAPLASMTIVARGGGGGSGSSGSHSSGSSSSGARGSGSSSGYSGSRSSGSSSAGYSGSRSGYTNPAGTHFGSSIPSSVGKSYSYGGYHFTYVPHPRSYWNTQPRNLYDPYDPRNWNNPFSPFYHYHLNMAAC